MRGLGVLLESGADQEDDRELRRREKSVRTSSFSRKLELEFKSAGHPGERIRAGGAGIPAFYTRTA